MLYLLGVVVSVAVLGFFAEKFVRSSSDMAALFKISPLIIGIVFMGFGTSLPELLVSIQAAVAGNGELALGNIVGSNVVNMTIILGIGAVITTLFVKSHVVKKEAPVAVIATALYAVAIIFATGHRIVAGLVLVGFGLFATFEQIQRSRKEKDDPFIQEIQKEISHLDGESKQKLLFKSVGFLAGLVAAAQCLVITAEGFADFINLSPVVTGIVLLAFGTSLPELASVVVAARKKEHELIVGNLWGSTLFNASFVGGASLLAGVAATVAWWVVALPVGIAALAWGLTSHELNVKRWEGIILIILGVLATAALVLLQ